MTRFNMAASLWKMVGRLSPHKFLDVCCFSRKNVRYAQSLAIDFSRIERKVARNGRHDAASTSSTPTLQFSKHFQTSSCLEKYYVKPNYLKKWGRRDIKRRALFKEHEMERSSLRLIKKSDILPQAVREKAASELDQLPLNSSITRVRNRCVLTDRGRGNVGRFRVSRMMFRYFADKGLISGVTRSQW